jgi:AcrR family transcriptional regulator
MSEATGSTTPRREATRQRLLDAAGALFAEVGLEAASVEAICERAGFTRGAFYSNFETKDELFVELARRVTRERVATVSARVRELEASGSLEMLVGDALGVVESALAMPADDRLGVLLQNEIRINALRSPQLAAAYLAQQDELREGVAQIIDDIAGAGVVRLRVSSVEAARLLMIAWEDAAVRAVMTGADDAGIHARANQAIVLVAQLLLEQPAAP